MKFPKIACQGTTSTDIIRRLDWEFYQKQPIPPVRDTWIYPKTEYVPDCVIEYECGMRQTYTSVLCTVKTKDGRVTSAVYVASVSNVPNNDGKCNRWNGWVEIPEEFMRTLPYVESLHELDWSFVENIFHGQTLEVEKWQYGLKSETNNM